MAPTNLVAEVRDIRIGYPTRNDEHNPTLMTAEELCARPGDGWCYELVRGERRRTPPAGSGHGVVSMNFGSLLHSFVRANSLGVVFSADTGFKIASDPDTMRAPDVAFIRHDRIPATGLPMSGLGLVCLILFR